MQTDDLAAQMVREMMEKPYPDIMEAIARRYIEKALTAQAEEIERLRGEPSEAQIEAAARTMHGMFYGYEGANPNGDPDDEDRAIARAALKAAQEVGR